MVFFIPSRARCGKHWGTPPPPASRLQLGEVRLGWCSLSGRGREGAHTRVVQPMPPACAEGRACRVDAACTGGLPFSPPPSRVPPEHLGTKRGTRILPIARSTFTLSPHHPCCNGGSAPSYSHTTRSFVARKGGQAETGGEAHEARAPFLQSLCPPPVAPPFAGEGYMAGARFLCVASGSCIAGRGCEHDPCAVLRAQPLHAPPFACHPAYADASVAPERWGAGVVHAERTWGRAHTQSGMGIRFPSVPPRSHALGFCDPAPAGRKGGGRTLWHADTQMEGGVPATPAACPLPPSRPLLAPPGPCLNGKGRGLVPRARVSRPCWGANEAPIYAQTGARPREGAAAGPALVVLFNLSGGKGRKGGGVLFRIALHSPFAHKAGWRKRRAEGGENGAPPHLAHVAHRRGR